MKKVMNDLSFDRLRRINMQRCERWHDDFYEPRPYTGWSGSDWSNAMGGESGEAQNVVKKIRRMEQGHRDYRHEDPILEDLIDKLGHELADMIIYADLLAEYYDIDLGQAVTEKFNRVSEANDMPERL